MIYINHYRERFESHDPEEDVCEADSRETLSYEEPVTFRELVKLLNSANGESSCYPCVGDTRDWVTLYNTNDGTRDYYETGAREDDSVHYSRCNPARNAKYWKWAMRAAGLIKG